MKFEQTLLILDLNYLIKILEYSDGELSSKDIIALRKTVSLLLKKTTKIISQNEINERFFQISDSLDEDGGNFRRDKLKNEIDG
jgi:hypothetical protein